MACNFRIILHQDRESIHLNLTGDFDGSSACELLNTIKTCSGNTNKVFIHTEGLKEVHPFGQAVFYNNFKDVNKENISFIFTGEWNHIGTLNAVFYRETSRAD